MAFKYILYRFSILFLILLSSCYSFSRVASSLNSEVKTIQINVVKDNSFFPGTSLTSKFTDELLNIFISRTNLKPLKNEGDIVLEGEFLKYNEIPINIEFNNAQKIRLIIDFYLRYTNKKEPKKNFEQNFEAQAEYLINETPSSEVVQNKLINTIVNQLVNNIYNKVVNDW